jgi:hypothetical protein
MSCDSRGPEENPALAGLLAIMRHIYLPNCGGGGFCDLPEAFLSRPPLRFADDQQGVSGKVISRRCLRRPAKAGPFLPGPWQAFFKIWPTNLEMNHKLDRRRENARINL